MNKESGNPRLWNPVSSARKLSRSSSSVIIVHFTIVYLVTWPVNENEAGVDLVLIESSMLFSGKFLLIRMTTTSLT